jgi:hypothetical protein
MAYYLASKITGFFQTELQLNSISEIIRKEKNSEPIASE